MKFTVKERVILLNGVLPVEGNVVSLRILRQLREDLSFEEDEQKTIEMRVNPELGQISWDPKCNDVVKEIEVGAIGASIIKEALEKLDKAKTLKMDMIELYEKFVEGKGLS